MAESPPDRRTEFEPGPQADSVLGALANSRRRAVARELMARPDETLSVETLGARVAERDSNTTETSRREVMLSLRHVHLPKLADAHIVRYDERTESVRSLENDLAEDLVAVAAEAVGNAADQ